MARTEPIQNSFVAGEVTPRLEGRDDLNQYFQSLRRSENAIILPHGGAMRRPGTRFVAEVKTSTSQVALLPFQFSTEQAYVIEAGAMYMRFFVNQGQLESSPGVPTEIVSPYLEDEVHDIQFAQSANVMYLTHGNQWPRKLSRTDPTTFSLAQVQFTNGIAPFLPKNGNGDLLLTLTGTTLGQNPQNGATFPFQFEAARDVGRFVRLNVDSTFRYMRIVSVTSATVAEVQQAPGSSTALANTTGNGTFEWAMGAFSDTVGPVAVFLHDSRLFYLGGIEADRVYASVTDDFDNFDDGDVASGTPAPDDDRAFSRPLVSDEVNAGRWLSTASSDLFIGTSGTEFRMRPANEDFLTPESVSVRPTTKRGSKLVRPVSVDNSIIYAQRGGQKIRRIAFNLQQDAFRSGDISILSEHIFNRNRQCERLGYQQTPDSIVWMLRGDGQMIGLTFEDEQTVLGFHRHRFGGDAEAESFTVIPTPDESEDQLWLVTRREIGGQVKRYVEFMDRQFRPDVNPRSSQDDRIDALLEAFYVDSGLMLDNPVAVTGITDDNPAVVTAPGHGFANGAQVQFRKVQGMTQVNRQTYTVANATTDTFELSGVDSSGFTPYTRGGVVRQVFTVIGGLEHLEGLTVQILADGAPHPDRVVENGSVTLQRPAGVVVAGLGYKSFGETQRFTGGNPTGTSQGHKQRTQRIAMRLHETLGLTLGAGENGEENAKPVVFRAGSVPMGSAPPLFYGDIEVSVGGGWDRIPTVYFEQNQPLPQTVLAIMPRNETNVR